MPIDIKICGLSTPDALEAALGGGATHAGFIFFAKSPRNVSPQLAGRLARTARGRAVCVAVTVDADDAMLDGIVGAMAPGMLQLHGKETPGRVEYLKARYRLPVMKALSIREPADLRAIDAYRQTADRILLDAKPPADALLPGGNGAPFDWSMLETLDRSLFYMLSGGINLANLREAMCVRPAGIDVSSGVENSPGKKDAGLVRQFLAEARRLERALAA